MTNTTIPDNWSGIPEEVEAIIASRTVRIRSKILQGKSVVRSTRERPMQFAEFAREVSIDPAQADRYIRRGVVPSGPARAKILAWVKKNRKRVKA